MHTYIQLQNQQVNRRHIKITYLLTAPEPAWAPNLKSLSPVTKKIWKTIQNVKNGVVWG